MVHSAARPSAATTTAPAVADYAVLHRRVEFGRADDETWRALARVCVELGKRSEAVAACRKIENETLRAGVHRHLVRLGWAQPEGGPVLVTDADFEATVREKLGESLHFLVSSQARELILGATLAFPFLMLITGACGVGASPLWVRMLASLPALAVFALAAALGRHMFGLALRSRRNADELPKLKRLVREAPKALGDVGLPAVAALLPAALAFGLGVPIAAALWLAFAAVLAPMVIAERFVGTPWKQLSPARIWRSVRIGGRRYLAVAATSALLLVPAAAAFLLTLDPSLWLAATLPGSLFVVPFVIAMRMLGVTLRDQPRPIAARRAI